ncbi:hypothetical protein PC128_g1829 [Phytophthora cactorum]|nr:hypothetical protein PC128_g1829 [Phytophthora cactorum]
MNHAFDEFKSDGVATPTPTLASDHARIGMADDNEDQSPRKGRGYQPWRVGSDRQKR